MNDTALSRRRFLQALSGAALAAWIAPSSATAKRLDVIVLGAGLAGLTAALKLKEKGLSIAVLEGASRVGGRIQALDTVPGAPELGARHIPAESASLRRCIEQFGLDLKELPTPSEHVTIVRGDHSIAPGDWPTSKHNPTEREERHIPPDRLFDTLLGKLNPLDEPERWLAPDFGGLDVKLSEFFQSKGVSSGALNLMEVGSDTLTLDTTSALYWCFRDAISRRHAGKPQGIRGGASRLVEAMATGLEGEIELRTAGVQIGRDAVSVGVNTANGANYQARKMIVTVPFSVLKHVAFLPELPWAMRSAVQTLPYTELTRIFLSADAPFWLDDGLGTSMWTDSPLERIVARDAVVECTVNGSQAVQFDRLSPAEQNAFVVQELKRLRPASEGHVEVVGAHSWARQPLARGAYSHLAPGQASYVFPLVQKPVGNLHFAGEHTETDCFGLEAAIRSGHRAAEEVIGAIE